MTALPPLDDTPFFLKKRNKTAYLHKTPSIKPNYGKPRRSLLPKTNIGRILLYDNTTQENLLGVKLRYYDTRKKMLFWSTQKNKDAFMQLQARRDKWHEVMQSRYQAMKDDFIARYGTRYMPIPTPEPEIDPFLIYARLAPPINILCFYLDQNPPDEHRDIRVKKPKKHRTLMSAPKPTSQSLKLDTDRLLGSLKTTVANVGYSRSIEDPRFRHLEECLQQPDAPTDGYIQLSPNYIKGKVPKRKAIPYSERFIELPPFYRKLLKIPDNVPAQSVIPEGGDVEEGENLKFQGSQQDRWS